MLLRATIVVVAFLTGACTEPAAVPRADGDPSPTVMLELRSGEEEPTAILVWGDDTQEGLLGTHCWAMRCVDFSGPPTPRTFTEISGDAEIEFRGDGTIETITVSVPPKQEFGQPVDEHQVRVRGGHAQLDLAPGRYMLVAFASWAAGGDAVFSFGVEVPA